MPTLFNGNNSDSDQELKINTDYAKNYNDWRQKEELNKLKTKYGDINENGTSGDSSESDSSSEEENENELTKQFDKDFYETLALLKNKDPKIYNQDVVFFDNTKKSQESNIDKRKNKSKKEKAVFLRDYERNIIVEKNGKFSDSEDETELRKNKEEAIKITYAQEQKQLKESFKNALHDEEEEQEGDFLKPKIKSESEKQKEDVDYKEWLKGQEASINENEQKVLKPLRDFWTDPNLDANEKFLRDYILNNKYLDKNYTGPDEDGDDNASHLIHDSDENLSEDEKNIEKQEEFEHKYNFRFEEPDQEFIKRYPRTMENSLRRKDNRRSQKRAEVRKRKDEEKLRKKEELKQLKALKKKEIEEKIEKLKEITGNEDIQFNNIDLDGDFDPSEHDRKMSEIFNDSYYTAPEDDIKPEFPDIDNELEIEDTWDNYDPTTENYVDDGGYDGPHCEDPDFIMDAEYNPSKSVQEEIDNPKKRKRRRKSKFAELIAKEKPKFDPQQYKNYEEYFDKYYSLDYEDMIGDIPCRFKYRKVVPNDYGLSVEEVLMADDKELNKWCSLKKALQYKTEHAELNDVQMYKQKARNEGLKKKILRSLYTEPEAEEEGNNEVGVNNVSGTGNTETKKKRRKKKKKVQETQNDTGELNNKTIEDSKTVEVDDKKIKSNTGTSQEKQTECPKVEKRKKVDEQSEQPRKKKRKADREESTDNTIDNKPEKEKESTNQQNNVQKLNDANIKSSKKLKSKAKMKKKTFDKMKRTDSKSKDINGDVASMNPERLKMYGINPKKLKNKLKYGKKRS